MLRHTSHYIIIIKPERKLYRQKMLGSKYINKEHDASVDDPRLP